MGYGPPLDQNHFEVAPGQHEDSDMGHGGWQQAPPSQYGGGSQHGGYGPGGRSA